MSTTTPVRGFLDADELTAVTESLVSLLAATGAIDRALGEEDAATMGPRDWARVVATDTFDAWLIRWPTGGAVEMHDHGGSAGVIAVLEGELTELRPSTEGRTAEEVTMIEEALPRFAAALNEVSSVVR